MKLVNLCNALKLGKLGFITRLWIASDGHQIARRMTRGRARMGRNRTRNLVQGKGIRYGA